MKVTATNKTKKTPLRMCVVCKSMLPKIELIRVVRAPEGSYCFDGTGRANGRGAYICNKSECVDKCLKKKILNKAFKENISADVYEKLAEEYANKQD